MVTGDVVRFTGITTLDTDPDRVLESAKGELESVVIVGYGKASDGSQVEYFASSISDGGTASWLLHRAIRRLHKTCDDMAEDG